MTSYGSQLLAALRLHGRSLRHLTTPRRGREALTAAAADLATSQYQGHVDVADSNRLAGWVADLHEPHRRLQVSVTLRGDEIASVVADRYRPDLADIGDGCHAFEYDISPAIGDRTGPISVRVSGTDYHVPYRGRDTFLVGPSIIKYIAADIVNNCNLRCPFCVVDYSGVKATHTMTEETFLSLLRLLPVVPAEGLWLSCLHEPTLHPRLDQFIQLIPPEYRHKAWFTTNLVRPLSDETFRSWARSGLHHINISLDTMDETLFPVLRRFGRLKDFRDNLERMVELFRTEPQAPQLRYITMAFRSNLAEIGKLVTESNERWLSSGNEIRYTINVSHIADEFRREHYLRKDDWRVLGECLERLPYECTIVYPPEEGDRKITGHYETAFTSARRRTGPASVRRDRPVALRVRPDGTIFVIGSEDYFSMNIQELEDPVAFFRDMTEPSGGHTGER